MSVTFEMNASERARVLNELAAKVRQAQAGASLPGESAPVAEVEHAETIVAQFNEINKFHDPLPEVPAVMKAKRQWVRWRLETVNTKPTKVPYQVNGEKASSSDPSTWTEYQTAVTGAIINTEQGVGFMFTGGFAGIDLDGSRNPKTGEITPWADGIIQSLDDVYVEVSPSGTGLHIFVLGKVPGADKKFNLNPAIGYGKAAIEIYDERRYFTVTGNSYFEEPGDVIVCDLTGVYQKLHDLRRDNPAPRNERAESADVGEPTKAKWHGLLHCSKYDIFKRGEILSPSHPFVIDNRIGQLEYPSQSEADLAFCTVLAIMHNGDADKIWDEYFDSAMVREKWLSREGDFRRLTIAKAIESAKSRTQHQNPVVEPPIPNAALAPVSQAQVQANVAAEASRDVVGMFPKPTDAIPPFDDSLLVGVSRKIADAVCGGTTIPRQYGSHVAKMMLSAIMTTYKIKLEGCDSPRSYFIVFGDTGTGKGEGEAFRRWMSILNCWTAKPFVYITDTIDSEAGLRDAFFDIPESRNAPLLYFVDEVLTLGQKADGKKNPEIIGGIIEFANKTTASRTKAKRGKNDQAMKVRPDSWLLLYACAQDGEAFATAFPRKKKQGLPDRFIPEYSAKVDAGDLPEPNFALGMEAIAEAVGIAEKLKNGISVSQDVRDQIAAIWNSQPDEMRKSPRLRQQFLLEMYFATFARGSAVAEAQDLAVAVKWFERQKAIRAVFFSEEIPDMVGVYTQRLRKVLEGMIKDLRSGKHLGEVAQSFRDLATTTSAYKDNDLTTFKRAWEAMIPFLVEIPVGAANGHVYQKVVPMPDETDTWLPAEYKLINPKRNW